MMCGFVSIRLRQLIYGKLTNQGVTYVSGTFVTLDTGLNNDPSKGEHPLRASPTQAFFNSLLECCVATVPKWFFNNLLGNGLAQLQGGTFQCEQISSLTGS